MRGTNRGKGVRVRECDIGNSSKRKRWTTEAIRKAEKEEAGNGDEGDDKDDDTDQIEGEDKRETYVGDYNSEDSGYQFSDLHKPFLMSVKSSNHIPTL
ncbi:hypothetical protein E2C01_082829 [Portunus trituberculatus]|uniref:Uncharacterized protein n=1 Tax=Portunus trituberculatus TaxID=210409 RepID=A0A5B7J1V4_PORTR|nr:hypothetical protein [Portunus trituberculatus]